ncbi:hypothetical protein HRD49_19480 [Corallococcus exiguus]|uniref:Uncharacterized protein n=1 Tax=Corallococcus carmarthensis TaxID=2316728 RepID=A0A3A8KAQ5_9BACT|nr:hypothetical protein [Corallococcus exiguus]RKH04417.1 hypothetical protein D7X32_11265 [Corallococcus carmarthensis]RYZ41704.1 MAG: hypothetical protein EOO71_10985 [Myxococcaceae bacterium]
MDGKPGPPADESDASHHQLHRQDDAVDVLTEALWELWLRRHAQPQRQAPAWSAEESAHG